MNKKIMFMLLLPILLIMVSAVILLFGVKENNKTIMIVGYILLASVSLLNIVIAFIRRNEGK